MKKFSFLLSVILVFCLAFLTSCSSIFDSSSSGATVSFRLNQDAVNALASKISSSRAGVPAELEDTTLSVTLYVNNKPVTQEAPLTQNGVLITFPHIIVGSKVSAFVQVKKGADLLAAGTSSETIRVKKGENLLSVTLRYAADGQLFFGDHVTIQLVASNASNEIWLNKGDWTIKLLDDNGNDILADVDWAAEDTDPQSNTPFLNQRILSITASLRKGHTQIFTNDNYYNYCSSKFNKLSLSQSSPLPEAGTYELTVTIQPSATVYMNKNQKWVPLPQFEPVSTTLELNVKNNYSFDVTGHNYFNSNGGDYESTLHDALTNLAENALVKISGTTSTGYTSILMNIKDNTRYGNKYNLDLGDLISTDTYADTIDSFAMENCETLVSIILPDDVKTLYTGIFGGCTSLERITFGSQIESFEYYSGNGVFQNCTSLKNFTIPATVTEIGRQTFVGCTALEEIVFEEPNNWYASDSRIDSEIEDWTTLTPVELSTTAQRLQLTDENGLGAKHLYRKTE